MLKRISLIISIYSLTFLLLPINAQERPESTTSEQPVRRAVETAPSVSSFSNNAIEEVNGVELINESFEIEQSIDPETYGMIWVEPNPKRSSKQYHVYNCNDIGKVYRPNAVKGNCIFVISKREFRIYVYEVVKGDTLLVAHFPVCLARNPQLADKVRSGDGTTPHCAKDRNGNFIPFTISQIASSSTWKHDFKDGRGNILAYGDYFMRLRLNGHRCSSNTSIGIHGSSNNELSVPGLDSEGCIRLRNNDLIQLHKFATVGTKVIIKPKESKKLPFEIEAQKKCKDYQSAKAGYANPLADFKIVKK